MAKIRSRKGTEEFLERKLTAIYQVCLENMLVLRPSAHSWPGAAGARPLQARPPSLGLGAALGRHGWKPGACPQEEAQTQLPVP